MRKDIIEWMRYMRNSLGFDGWRFDFVKVRRRRLPACLPQRACRSRLHRPLACLPACLGACATASTLLALLLDPGWRCCSCTPPPQGYEGRYVEEYINATVPAMAFGEYWDTCSYTDGVLNYNQDGHRQRTVDWVDATGSTSAAFGERRAGGRAHEGVEGRGMLRACGHGAAGLVLAPGRAAGAPASLRCLL